MNIEKLKEIIENIDPENISDEDILQLDRQLRH